MKSLAPLILILLCGCTTTQPAVKAPQATVVNPASMQAVVAKLAVVPSAIAPQPTIVPAGSNGWWQVVWNPGSEITRSNYMWFIWSTTNLALPLQDEPQQWNGSDLIFRPQPNYFFGLHGITNLLGL